MHCRPPIRKFLMSFTINVVPFIRKSQKFHSWTFDFERKINIMRRCGKVIKNNDWFVWRSFFYSFWFVCITKNERLTCCQNRYFERIIIVCTTYYVLLRLFILQNISQLTLFPSLCNRWPSIPYFPGFELFVAIFFMTADAIAHWKNCIVLIFGVRLWKYMSVV